MSSRSCSYCGGRMFRADRSLAGRLVCNSCGAPLGPNVRRRQSMSSRKFQLNSKLKLRWLIILAMFATSLLILLM